MCIDTGLLVKGETGDSHRDGAEALHDFLAMKGEGTDPSKRRQPFVSRQRVIPEDLNLTVSSTEFNFKKCTGCIKIKTEARPTIIF
jgi:hypothetical protein